MMTPCYWQMMFLKKWHICCRRKLPLNLRNLHSQSGVWEKKFTPEIRKELEKFWKDRRNCLSPNISKPELHGKYYVLSMFPYPSGKLHMGHVRVYTISDAMARYHRLLGERVIHPMGWDSFGLPAENAAIDRGVKPDEWTHSNIQNMKTQLLELGFNFDWNREISTCDSEYYKWTQHIFLKMFEEGLVYQKKGEVNWDPVDQTVLADEQIDEKGRSWRSGAVVEKKFLKQWYIRTTAYSKSLYDGLNEVDADLWRDIILLQQNWIGNCNGVRFEFQLQDSKDDDLSASLSVFSFRPEAIFGISHILLSNGHFLNNPAYFKMENSTSSSQELTVSAIHPFTKQKIPIFVMPSWDFGEFLDAHIGIPCCNEKDMEFARLHNLPHVNVLDVDQNRVINSAQFSGMGFKEAFSAVSNAAKEMKCGGHITSEKARDWLISRQRYWGTPIPIVHCKKYGAVPVAYEDLPVTLPNIDQFRSQGNISPLASAEQWINVKCSKCDCGGFGRRETDTMDTFVDSSWYYLRYLDPRNDHMPFSPDMVGQMPVDLYIGGKEHAILHLYYARFFNHFLHDQGLVPTREPFVNLLTQGMVMSQSYRLKQNGKYLPSSDIDFSDKKPKQKGTGADILVQWEKMSKSKYNGVDPQEILNEYGADSTRLCILSNVSPKSDRLWSNDVFVGVLRWQGRIWNLVSSYISVKTDTKVSLKEPDQEQMRLMDEDICNNRNQSVLEVSFHMSKTFLINTAISRLHSLTNVLKKAPNEVIQYSWQFERALADLIIMVSPFAPMFASELWHGFASVPHKRTDYNWAGGIFEQTWPITDNDHKLPMAVKVNGKDVFEVRLPMTHGQTSSLTLEQALNLIQSHEDYARHVQTRQVLNKVLRNNCNIKVELEFTTSEKKKQKSEKQVI